MLHFLTIILVAFSLLGTTHKGKMKIAVSNAFSLDTSINGLILCNGPSIYNKAGDLMPKLDSTEALPSVMLLSHDRKQYLRLVFHPGSSTNEFDEFEVGYASGTNKTLAKGRSSEAVFRTESGIELGLSMDQVIKLKGQGYMQTKRGKYSIIGYKIEDEKSPFLNRYNLPSYLAEYYFNNEGKLVKFGFGFEYP